MGKNGLTKGYLCAKNETKDHTYQIYEDEDKTTITKGIKGGRGAYGGKSTIGDDEDE